jgi:glycosyltransferase involved in cell wall biosynthesis
LRSKRVSSSLPALVRYLRKERPQALLSALNHANVIAVIAHRLANVPTRLVLSERTNVSRSANQPQTLRQRCVLPLMRWSYRKADALVAVSEGVADDLARTISLPREHIDVVYNPVITAELERRAGEAVDHPWFGEGKPPVILAVGRLTPAKDYPTLLRAFSKVRSKHDCRLIILGEGELRPKLEALVKDLDIGDSVQMPGFVENPFSWMRQATLFVLSSAWEGLPNVLIQAMACGTQVISTDCDSGPREILEGGKWGQLVPVSSPDAMAKAICSQIQNPTILEVSQRADYFSDTHAVENFLGVIKKIT